MEIGINRYTDFNRDFETATNSKETQSTSIQSDKAATINLEANPTAIANPTFSVGVRAQESALFANFLAAQLNSQLDSQAKTINTTSTNTTNALSDGSHTGGNSSYDGSHTGGNTSSSQNAAASSSSSADASVQSNPLYEGAGNEGTNPLFAG